MFRRVGNAIRNVAGRVGNAIRNVADRIRNRVSGGSPSSRSSDS